MGSLTGKKTLAAFGAARPWRARRSALLAVGFAVLAVLLLINERRAQPWRWLAKELGPVPPAFLLPLNTLSQGVQTALETGPQGEKILWGYGPQSQLRFTTYAPMRLRLCYSFETPITGQAVRVLLNGRQVAVYAATGATLRIAPDKPACHEFTSRQGENRIQLAYRLWNHGNSDFAADDPRPLAVTFTRLQLLPVGDGRPGS